MRSTFDSSAFTPQQIAELENSAISLEVATRAGLYSIEDAKAAAKLLGRGARYWAGHLPVLVYPYRLPFQRDPVRHRGKPSAPFENRKPDGSVVLAKYVEPKGSPVHVYFTPSLLEGRALKDVSVALWVTEGEKKALSADRQGLACLAVSGVHQWHLKGEKTLHPDFAHVALEGREVFLAFDRDALVNKDVRQQEVELGRALESAGATVRVVRFPEDAPKLDDFLARHELSELSELMEDARKHGQLPEDAITADKDWQTVFPRLRLDSETKRPIKDTDNVARILLHHPAWSGVLGFDLRRDSQVFLRSPPFPDDLNDGKSRVPRETEDDDATRVAAWLVSQLCLGWAKAPPHHQIEHAMSLAAKQRRFDPVAEYLKSLTWDGVPRLDNMAVSHFGAADTPYARTVVAKWMLSAVARVRTPGCQADHVLVLEGDQGLRKSSALRILAGDEHFSDNLPADVASKDAADHLSTAWIVEISELAALKRSEVEDVKSFVTRREDRFRPAYGRRTVNRPRRSIFAATTNDDQYLKDLTGNRRWWGLACGFIDLEAIKRDRDQLWAEALARVRAGECWHVEDQTLSASIAEEQEARRERDPWEDRLPHLLARKSFVVSHELLALLDAKDTQPEANRLARVLKRLGWRRTRETRETREGKQRIWGYSRRGAAAPSQSQVGQAAPTGTGNAEEFPCDVPVSQYVPVDSEGRGKQSNAATDSAKCEADNHPSEENNWDNWDNWDSTSQVSDFASEEPVPVAPHDRSRYWDNWDRGRPVTPFWTLNTVADVVRLAEHLSAHPEQIEGLAFRPANGNGAGPQRRPQLPCMTGDLARWYRAHPEELARDAHQQEAAQ